MGSPLKFKKRYTLAIASVTFNTYSIHFQPIKWPKELWAAELPKYKLILKRPGEIFLIGEGYPWCFGLGTKYSPYYGIGLMNHSRGTANQQMPTNILLRADKAYEVILERVD